MKIHRTFVLTSQDVPELVNGIQVRSQEPTQKTLFETKEVEQGDHDRGRLFDCPQLRIAPNRTGVGEASATELRVPGGDPLHWRVQLLEDFGVEQGGSRGAIS